MFCYENNFFSIVYVSDQKFDDRMDLLLISDKNKSHYMYIKVLIDLYVIRQNLRQKNTFENIVYNVLVVKKP